MSGTTRMRFLRDGAEGVAWRSRAARRVCLTFRPPIPGADPLPSRVKGDRCARHAHSQSTRCRSLSSRCSQGKGRLSVRTSLSMTLLNSAAAWVWFLSIADPCHYVKGPQRRDVRALRPLRRLRLNMALWPPRFSLGAGMAPDLGRHTSQGAVGIRNSSAAQLN